MANTGYKAYAKLEQYDTLTGVATGITKSNISTDPDYVAPVYDTSMCPIPPTLTISPTTLSKGSGTTSACTTVTSNTNWLITNYPPWMSTPFGNSGSGNGSACVSLTENTSTSPRTGSFYIRTSDNMIIHSVSVTQAAMSSALTISPTSITVDSTGTTFTVTVTSNTSWTVSDNGLWISTSKTSGTGNSSFTVTVQSNSGEIRNGIVTVKTSDNAQTRTVDINQEAPALSIVQDYLAYNQNSSNCGASPNLTRWHNGVGLGGFPDFGMATELYSNSSGTIKATAGYYTNGMVSRRWTGTSFTTTVFC